MERRKKNRIERDKRFEAARIRREEESKKPTYDQVLADNAALRSRCERLEEELTNADFQICQLCKVINPQHAECTWCEHHAERLSVLSHPDGVAEKKEG